ncbi:MAG: PhzF family phenazine biosynthesis protein [Oscillospiraceae bacterium]|nr:PhzF family phenazine biosynthesis protein [Oscillospiraceae bacterium]MBQ2895665.1 PhzF family phenazine biosynthesis protein [Oscillospiraceae bacterium]MBQ3532447.1 PhzF family phenazine biosynthesis protein [Oscillospiraceae bacterium]
MLPKQAAPSWAAGRWAPRSATAFDGKYPQKWRGPRRKILLRSFFNLLFPLFVLLQAKQARRLSHETICCRCVYRPGFRRQSRRCLPFGSLACGSGHCHIIPYWADVLGQTELTAYQASSRGGVLYCRMDGDRIRLAGRAALYAISELFVEM